MTVDLLLKGTVHMRNQMLRWDGEDLYWSELRPDEAGRIVVCRRDAGGAVTDFTPPGFNARTRVHEYGGGQFAVSAGEVMMPLASVMTVVDVNPPVNVADAPLPPAVI